MLNDAFGFVMIGPRVSFAIKNILDGFLEGNIALPDIIEQALGVSTAPRPAISMMSSLTLSLHCNRILKGSSTE